MGKERIVNLLWVSARPLFATVDLARGEDVHLPFPSRDAKVASLYSGDVGDALLAVAPQILSIGENRALLERLVEDGWGRSSLLFLSSAESFDAVRRHLRRFLRVKTEEGETLFFRFYDPRVLRVFLPTCTHDQLTEFFGPIQAFWAEGEDPLTCLVFRLGNNGLETEVIDLHA